jgi:4-hydroxybenzoate polyprenyltransferase
VFVWLYDAAMKRTFVAPLLMGGCRFLNVLLGMSVAAQLNGPPWLCGFGPDQLLVAGGIGVYIVGVTCYASSESQTSRRGILILGIAVMMVGVVMLAMYPRIAEEGTRFYLEPYQIWPLTLAIVMLATLRRCLAGVFDPQPQMVQAAVKQCIFSLIFLNACVCLLVAQWWALAVLALLVPTVILGRWVYST